MKGTEFKSPILCKYPTGCLLPAEFLNKLVCLIKLVCPYSGNLNLESLWSFLQQVWPITNFFEQQINISSKKLVEEHARKWPSKRILLQVWLETPWLTVFAQNCSKRHASFFSFSDRHEVSPLPSRQLQRHICPHLRVSAGVYDKPTSPSPTPPSPSPLSLSPHIKNWMLGHVSSFFASRDFEIRVTKWIRVLTITCPYHFIVRQRQMLRAVPVSEVFYEWKDTSSRYWVFGLDHQVYAPDYPQKCCCGCSILWRWRDVRDIYICHATLLNFLLFWRKEFIVLCFIGEFVNCNA